MNSFPFDWLLRQKAAVHVSLYILSELPVPDLAPDADRFVAHGCLRLCCNHRGFASLWREQVGTAWRETTPHHSWPVITAETDRWRLRAAMDAVIAHAYGLSRVQYQRILACFSHKSCPAAPAHCLVAYDELECAGLAAFCRDHDRYSDIPLVTEFAQPVIRLPAPPADRRSLLPAGTGSAPA
jgi:hypothetical protein